MDERFLRQAVDASGEVIFTTDLRGTITYVNPEFVRVYGYRPEDVVGQTTPRILKGGSTSAEEYEDFWRRLSDHEIVRKEFTNKTKDGVTVQVETSANPIASNGRVV